MKTGLLTPLVLLLIATAVSRAGNVTMTANDAIGTTSFNAAGTWSDGLAPSAGNAYSTLGFLLRSPTTGGTYTFAGDSLTIGGGSGGAVFSTVSGNNNALIFKVSAIDLVVNNLILDGSQIRDGNGSGQWAALDGNISVTANGGAFIAQDTNIINSAISGSGPLYIGDNGNGDPARVILFTSGSSTYSGSILFNNSHASAAYSVADWAAGSALNFDIGANGINNNISGDGTATFAGTFNFNLSGAGNVLGDSWTIANVTNQTFSGTFSVNGFTQNGTVWDKTANGTTYQFDPANGVLSVVPEPSVLAVAALGLAALFGVRSRRSA